MVVIRLARGGAKKAPFYQIVAADKRDPRDGRFIEKLGYFNPLARGKAVRLEVQQERIDYWLGQGAQPSERVASLLKKLKKTADTPAADVLTRGQARKEQSENAAAAQAAKAKKDADAAAKEAAAEAATEKADPADKAE